MAVFHLSVTQIKRSAGQSAVASAAYRAGEKLYSEYYGEYSDYTNKSGVIYSEIMLPSYVPKEYSDRQTLWNAVEKAERGKNAQLAYSFDIALQNELSTEENIELARQFLSEHFLSKGMIVDFAVHQPDKKNGGISNPHFHVLCPIRPVEFNGKWGCKQHRVYALDENGNRLKDKNGRYVFKAVPSTDWGNPETLEFWRKQWAAMCNARFKEKGLKISIDNRSYEKQGVDLLPTVHEGANVRAMEEKGIKTEKGEFNRWVKATNALIREIRKRIASLFEWLSEIKHELVKQHSPDFVSLLNAYYSYRNSGACSQKAKVGNLKRMSETINYLEENRLFTIEDLENSLKSKRSRINSLKAAMDKRNARMKAIRQLKNYSETFKNLRPVFEEFQKIRFEKPKARYREEHESELKQFFMIRRKLRKEFPDGKFDMKKLSSEYQKLEEANAAAYKDFKTVRNDLQQLWRIRTHIEKAAEFKELTEEKVIQDKTKKSQKKDDIIL